MNRLVVTLLSVSAIFFVGGMVATPENVLGMFFCATCAGVAYAVASEERKKA